MNTRRIAKLTIILAFLFGILTNAYGARSVSVFIGSDRHCAYETIRQLPADEESGRPLEVPVYDPLGNLIWHNNLTELLLRVSQDRQAVQPRLFIFGGDNVGSGSDYSLDSTGYPIGAPYFSVKSIDAQVHSVFGDQVTTIYTYGSHDRNSVDDYAGTFLSGPYAYEGFYVYGISYAQMIFDTEPDESYDGKDRDDPYGICADTATRGFLSWAEGLEDNNPILIVSHVPMHANRGDNLGSLTWAKAINQVAKDHDIVFLWGHNHTVEARESQRDVEVANHLLFPGQEIKVQSYTLDDGDTVPVAETVELGFTYMNAGYIKEGMSSLLTFKDQDDDGSWDFLISSRYKLNESRKMDIVIFLKH